MIQQQKRKSRELALQVLFQREFTPKMDLPTIMENLCQNFEMDELNKEYAVLILEKLVLHTAPIDAQLESHSTSWGLKRMALVDLNILRVAACEILYLSDVTPEKVALDEALEISKKYGGADSTSFINGILDQILQTKS